MLHSMTGFAARQGEFAGFSWQWDLRAVNAKGLDIRLRVPDWIPGLEQDLRSVLGKALARGSVSLGLRLQGSDSEGRLSVNEVQLGQILDALSDVQNRAENKGLVLAPTSAADILTTRGVLEAVSEETDTEALKKALLADLPPLIEDFQNMRRREGQALAEVLSAQLAQVAGLTSAAAVEAEKRKDEMAATLRGNLARVLDNSEGADEARVAQELAMLVVKADVTEEIDRLHTHVGAAGDLIAQGSPVGRKLDFLMQEFNREANTLCSKANSTALTGIGLELKTVIDQMREQVQNVE